MRNTLESEKIADIKNQLANTNWRLCDGSLFQDDESPIYNVNGRYLPNLIRDITLGGGDGVGAIAGSNLLSDNKADTHDFTPIPLRRNVGIIGSSRGGNFRVLSNPDNIDTYRNNTGIQVGSGIDTNSLLAPVYESTTNPGDAITSQGSDDVNIRNKTLQTFYIQKVK